MEYQMPVSAQLAALESNLQAYHGHLKSLREAMQALLNASDLILADVENDKRLIAVLTEQETASAAIEADEPVTVAAIANASIEEIADIEMPAAASDVDKPVSASALSENGQPSAGHGIPDIAINEQSSPSTDVHAEDEPEPANAATLGALEAIAAVRTAEATADDSKGTIDLQTAPAAMRTGAGEIAAAAGDRKVIDFKKQNAAQRIQPKSMRRAAAIAASLVITAGVVTGLTSLAHSEIGQRILSLGTCDADMVSAYRDCAFLAWLLL
jgi:hypothetical protein